MKMPHAATTATLIRSRHTMLRQHLAERAGRVLLASIAAVTAVAVLAIMIFIVRDALPFFESNSARDFFLSTNWYPARAEPEFGAAAIFFGSFLVTTTAVVLAVPVGILAALCLSDVLPFGVRQIAKPVVEMLAAVPSVVYGFFALSSLAPYMQRLGLESGANALTAAIVLGVMALPTIVSVAEDALQAVGRDIREGSYALGATRAETLLRVVLPSAAGGIVSAVILGVMRAVGETMVVWMASGNAAQIPSPWFDLTQPVRTLTATIAGDMGEADQMTGSAHYHVLFVMGACLLLFSFACSLMGEHIIRRQHRRLKGL